MVLFEVFPSVAGCISRRETSRDKIQFLRGLYIYCSETCRTTSRGLRVKYLNLLPSEILFQYCYIPALSVLHTLISRDVFGQKGIVLPITEGLVSERKGLLIIHRSGG